MKEEGEIDLVQGKTINFPMKLGKFMFTPFQDSITELEHICIHKGEWNNEDPVLTRIHSSCITGDIFASLKCDCGDQLIESFRRIERAGSGIIVYLQQEGRGIGLMKKIEAYSLQEEGFDTVDANLKLGFKDDERNYEIAAEILKVMHVENVILMTNNPLKADGLSNYGIKVSSLQPIWTPQNEFNSKYIHTKIVRMNHIK